MNIFKFCIILCFVLNFSSCRPSVNSITIKNVDSLSFRRSYAGSGDWQADRDPNAMYGNNLTTQSKLAKLGLLHIDSLRLSKFKSLDIFILKSKKNDSLKVFSKYIDGSPNYHVFITNGIDTGKIKIPIDNPDIKFALVDFIPGNFPEIVLLRNFYIMNGDNYDINIYQVYK